MTTPRFERVREVFLAAADAAPSDRGAILDSMCAGDLALRAEVESLLSNAPTGAFLEPAKGTAVPMGASERITPSTGAMEMPRSIGPYKLLQVIGEGGFGVVYMAEQEKPVRRRVALKLIRLGMDTKHVLARFEAERQALAMMDHPNIARVLDAGATDAGRPYFVMELVRGVPITEYCDHEKLSTEARLGLFIAVCRAVQHAHQKGIIHRDIKPTNILVTLHDGVPVPKVIDFGIAKATNARLTERTLFTEFRQFIGTPEYMSPEQAEMSGLDVDTRSDIYSLGVLLYELLSGVTPLDGARLRSEGWAGMQKLIRDFEPIRPSVRLSAGDDATTATARNRGVGVAELKRSLTGDLDWIALHALEKDRSRRYETAAAFAADVERFLRNEPVEARPPSIAYRTRKFIRRNSGAVVLASIVVIGLAVSATALGFLYAREREAAHRAESAEASERSLREEAQANLERAEQSEANVRAALERSEQVKELLKSALGAGASAEGVWSREAAASEVLDRFRTGLEAQGNEDPDVIAELLGALGDSYVQLGMNDRALAVRRQAAEKAEAAWGPTDPRTLKLLTDLAWIESEVGAPDNARIILDRILSMPSEEELSPETRARACYVLANTWANAADANRAIDLYNQSIAIARTSQDREFARALGATNGLANALFQASRFDESLVISEQLAREEPIRSPASFNLLRGWHRHAGRLWDLGRCAEAIDVMRRVAEISDQTLGPQHADTTSRWHAVAEWLVVSGRAAEAESILDRVLGVVGSEHRTVEHAKMLKVAAWAAFARDDPARAESRMREAIEVSVASHLDGYDGSEVVWRDAQVWRLTLHRARWADAALRRAIRGLVNDRLTTMEPGPEKAGDWIDWSALRWDLVHHGDESAPVRSGTLTDLLSTSGLPEGLYAMRIRAPRESGEMIDVWGWFLLADWTVREFAVDGYTPDYPDRFEAGAASPDITRAERFLEYTWEPELRQGSIARNVGYGIVADARCPVPAGAYRVGVTSDDGERFLVDGAPVTQAWLGRSEATDEAVVTVEAGDPGVWRVEYFQGADSASLRFRVEPDDPEARARTLARIGVTEPATP